MVELTHTTRISHVSHISNLYIVTAAELLHLRAIFGFNNNNWSGWTYVRCGHKKNDVTATITTADPFAFAISKVEMDVDTYDSSKYSQYVNSTRLEISSSADFSTDVETVEIELAKGTNVFEIASPAANKYYRIVVETTGSGTNGFIQVSKISYIAQ